MQKDNFTRRRSLSPVAWILTVAGCNSEPTPQPSISGELGPCVHALATLECTEIMGEAPVGTDLEFESVGSGLYCVEFALERPSPHQVSGTLVLDSVIKLFDIDHDADLLSREFEVDRGLHSLTLEGTERSDGELCLYASAQTKIVEVVYPMIPGDLSEPQTQFQLSWPAGAVDSETTIWCGATGTNKVSCRPYGTQFKTSVTVSFPYTVDPAGQASGIYPVIYRDNEPLVTALGLNPPIAYAETDHLSDFELRIEAPLEIKETLRHIGGVRGVDYGEAGYFIPFRSRAGYRYTLTSTTPPMGNQLVDGNIDIFGHLGSPSVVGLDEFIAQATSSGWWSDNTPYADMEIAHYGGVESSLHVRGTEDAFSFNSTEDGVFHVLLIGNEQGRESRATFRVVESKVEDVPSSFLDTQQEGVLWWPFEDGCYAPTEYGQFNSTWGNGMFDPYYVGDGHEDSRYMIHSGVDVDCAPGTGIRAICDGDAVVVGYLGSDTLGYSWGGHVQQQCELPDGQIITVGYLHIVPAIPPSGYLSAGEPIGTITTLSLPGEPQHLHLGICMGEYDSTDPYGCKPQAGAHQDRYFPYRTPENTQDQVTREINPDICTNPGIWRAGDVELSGVHCP